MSGRQKRSALQYTAEQVTNAQLDRKQIWGRFATIVLAGFALFAFQFLVVFMSVPSNYVTDPWLIFMTFADVLLWPTLILAFALIFASRLRQTSRTNILSKKNELSADDYQKWMPEAMASVGGMLALVVAILVIFEILISIVVWALPDIPPIGPVCQLSPQCAGTDLINDVRWQFLAAMLARFFFVLVALVMYQDMLELNNLHSPTAMALLAHSDRAKAEALD